MTQRKGQLRIEKDQMGELAIPCESYYGIATQRLLNTYPQYGKRVNPRLIEALAHVKKAVLSTAFSENLVDENEFSQSMLNALLKACEEIQEGNFNKDIVVDALAGASGFALNVNLNEVIANRAGEILGDAPGTGQQIKIEKHINICSALEDLYPTAMRVAILLAAKTLKTVLLDLERTLRRKSLEFESVVKLGRINLQDSLPVTLGQEFNAYGSAIERALKRVSEACLCLREVNLGGTKVGTGFGVSHSFQFQAVQALSTQTKLELRPSDDYLKTTSSVSDFLEFSSSLRELACDLLKMTNDLAFLSSGPKGGAAEIIFSVSNLNDELSIAAYQILANDQAVLLAGQGGKLESNIFTTIIIHSILDSMQMLESSIASFTVNCLSQLKADQRHCRFVLESSDIMLSIFAQELGEKKAFEIFSKAKEENKSMKEVIFEQKLLSKDTLDRLTGYKYMTSAQR